MAGSKKAFVEKRVADRRASSQNIIRQLVEERTHMLSLYGDLAIQNQLMESNDVYEVLEQFCQTLIDYTADSHFRLYRFIDEKKERRQNVMEVADDLYPRIVATTQSILDFNDKYDFGSKPKEVSELRDDLSLLGENLADRIDYEDQVIESLIYGRSYSS